MRLSDKILKIIYHLNDIMFIAAKESECELSWKVGQKKVVSNRINYQKYIRNRKANQMCPSILLYISACVFKKGFKNL